MSHNIILNTDSYKYSQWNQYPANTEYVYSYIEARGNGNTDVVFFGLQAFIKEYLLKPVTMADIDEAESIVTAHGEPFYREGWEYIVSQYGGKLPVVIKAVPEGTIVPTGNVLVTIENTDPNCWWLTSFLETALLRGVWYPTTVATNSFNSKKIIKHYLELTGDTSLLPFKLHDFGARGVSSQESAALGGLAHLVNFMGTDTVSAIVAARKYYGENMAGFSIPAMEHSTVTSWGREREVDAYRNMLVKHAKPGGLVACVSDSYDIYAACEKWGTELKQDVINSGATVVIRPDSGNPVKVVVKCLQILDKYFGSTVNDKGYKVLNNVRVIQGDGITTTSIDDILQNITKEGFSADNVAFGQGGALLQQVNRDTLKFAMKCSCVGIYVGGKIHWVPVSKSPVTDPDKKSKSGRVTLYKDPTGFRSGVEDWEQSVLKTVFLNGELKLEYSFQKVRNNASI